MKKIMFLTMLLGLMFIAANDVSAQTNIALNKPTTQSSNYDQAAFPASKAVDGITTGTGGDFTHTRDENGGWWQVDLGDVYNINKIQIWNRSDECCWNRLQNFYVMVSETPITSNSTAKNTTSGPHSFTQPPGIHPSMILENPRRGRYVRIFLDNGTLPLSLAEVQVFGQKGSSANPDFSIPVEGYTGPTTKRELTISLPFAKAQKLPVEVADDGKIIFQGDMVVGNISDFAGSNPQSSDVNSWIQPNSSIPYIIKAGYGKRDLSSADTKFFDSTRSDPPSYVDNSSIWTNSTIPYDLPAGHGKRDVILAAINEINSKTNLCLVPRTNQTDYVQFISQNGKGFWATLGRAGGRQEISIDQTASYVPMGTVAHEIMHAAGFSHMQSREDRDNYVIINSRNIVSGKEGNFKRLEDKASNIGPYDFTSVMHYYAKAFAINTGRNTIDVKGVGDSSKMGQRDALSSGDVAAIASIYDPGQCKPAGKKPTATKPTATPQPTQPNKTPPTTTGNGNAGNIAIGKNACSKEVDGKKVNFKVINNTDKPLVVNFVDHKCKEGSSNNKIAPGGSTDIFGYNGHVFRVREVGTNTLLKEIVAAPTNPSQFTIGSPK